jgi:hypothetical protein
MWSWYILTDLQTIQISARMPLQHPEPTGDQK